MARIELYDNEDDAVNMRDHYNHNLGMRAVVALVPQDEVVDYGGGPVNRIFQSSINPSAWMLVVEG